MAVNRQLTSNTKNTHKYILLDVLLCSIAEYFYKRVKILPDTTQQNVLYELYYPTRQIVMSVRANFADIYLREMRDRSMPSGTELAREIQLTNWSTAGEQGKPV